MYYRIAIKCCSESFKDDRKNENTYSFERLSSKLLHQNDTVKDAPEQIDRCINKLELKPQK